MNYTSIEQSKKLLELGLSPESADMAWIDRPTRVTDCPEVPVIMDIELESMIPQNKLIPCWSVGALLGLIPCPKLGFSMASTAFPWICTAYTPKRDIICEKVGAEMLEAAYNMVVWLLENNYINKKGDKH